jgi:hypothetical protein
MHTSEVRPTLAAMAGYWPTPQLTEEEVVAWTTELTGPIGISYTEAVKVIRAEGARQWRPRPGEFVELIQHYRRQDALRKPRPALPSGIRIASKEMNDEWIVKCRDLLKAGR